MRRLSETDRCEIWDRFEAGESLRSISRQLGRPPSTVRTHVVAAGFRRPVPTGEWSLMRLSLQEREEISRGLAAGEKLRGIANRLGRAASTVSREVASNGGRRKYRATVAHRGSRHRACRPKPAKLTPIIGSDKSSRRSRRGCGRLSRSRGGSLRHTLTMRRCA